MIHDYSRVNDLLDFFLSEPESSGDHDEMMKEASVDEIKKLMDLGANLVGSGVRVMRDAIS